MLFFLSAIPAALLRNTFKHELSATLGRRFVPLLKFLSSHLLLTIKNQAMKNLKKVSRAGLRTIQGGVFVTCTLPNGEQQDAETDVLRIFVALQAICDSSQWISAEMEFKNNFHIKKTGKPSYF